MGNQERINFHQHNKVLVQSCVQCYHQCQKRRYVVLHDLEVKIKVLKDEALNILEEANKEEVEGLKRYFEVRTMNVSNASTDETLLCVRSERALKRRAKKSVHQDMRNMLNVRVIQKATLKSIMFENYLSKHIAIGLCVI